MEKRCPKCDTVKPAAEFSKNKSTQDGRQAYCKGCFSDIPRKPRMGSHTQTRIRRALLLVDGLKDCCTCKVVKPISEFYKNAKSPDGLCYPCKDCQTESAKKSTAKNPEARREFMREYYQRPGRKEHQRELDRIRRLENPEQAKQRTRDKNNRRRARILGVVSLPITRGMLDAKWAYWGNRCWMCGGDAETMDHVKPLSKGGAHMLCNLRPACQSCNSRKRDAWPYSPPRRDDIAAAAA